MSRRAQFGLVARARTRAERTEDFARYNAVEEIEEQVWPRLVVLAETCDEAIRVIQAQESEILGRVAQEMFEANAKRLEGERLVAEHRAAPWQADRLGRWVLATTENGPVSSQPRPVQGPAPSSFDPANVALQRPWWTADRRVHA